MTVVVYLAVGPAVVYKDIAKVEADTDGNLRLGRHSWGIFTRQVAFHPAGRWHRVEADPE